MIRRPPRSTLDRSSAASDVYKRQMVNRQCKGSSLGPGGPQPYPLTIPRHSLLLCTFILASAKLTFLSFRHSFTDSIHFLFGLPAGRFPTHSPLYFRLTNRLSFILST